VQVALRVHRSTEEQTFSLHREATVGDLLRQMPDAHAARILIRVKPTGKVRAHWDSKWTELPPDVPLGMLANTAPALKGPAADVALQVELSPDAALGLGVEPWLPPWPFPMWPGKYPVLKVTVLTATRMLAELRAAYDEPDFQREYRQLRRAGGMSRHVGKALSVQCDIVQRYGFAGDLGGVEEMRKQATYWANTDPAVVKLLRDIHGHLEYGKPWRKVLVPEAFNARTARCRAGRAALGAWWPTAPSEEQAAQLRGDVQAACEEAARRIAEADVLLLCTGAGFSADSGLAVYADVAEVEAYRVRGLEYHDLCTPKWLRDEPELFWGFWGQCFNDYRGTAPHEGYSIVARWADRRFRRSGVAEAVNFRLAEFAALSRASAGSGAGQPYVVKDHAGAFFAFTSNVDAHHFDWFRACEIRECHGNTELYQCGAHRDSPCQAVWRAPLDYHFCVDTETMLAAAGAPGRGKHVGESSPGTAAGEGNMAGVQHASACSAVGDADSIVADASVGADHTIASSDAASATSIVDGAEIAGAVENLGATADGNEAGGAAAPTPGLCGEAAPRVGRVRGGGRVTTLRHMPGTPPSAVDAFGFRSNHPSCPSCHGPARPAILMFGDMAWQDVDSQEERWQAWTHAVCAEISAAKEQGRPQLRAAILEIGAGGNVTTVRNTSERQLNNFLRCGADARLIRVNPDYPLGDGDEFQPGGEAAGYIVSIMSRGLESLERMDAAMNV